METVIAIRIEIPGFTDPQLNVLRSNKREEFEKKRPASANSRPAASSPFRGPFTNVLKPVCFATALYLLIPMPQP